MSCTRTGAHIWLEPYGEWLYGDAFEIMPRPVSKTTGEEPTLKELVVSPFLFVPVAYFMVVARSFLPINGLAVKHYTVRDYDNWFNKGDVEQALLGSMLITNNFVNHGYYGEKIDVLHG